MFTKSTGNKFSTISVHDLDERLGKIDLIDIREDYEYKSGHIPKAENIPMGQLLATPDKYLDKEKEYHIICQSGGRSARACDELSSQGYKIINVSGGTGSYIKPLER